MKVSVIGPGAMGCLFAARLAHAGIQTTLVDYKPERAQRLNASGICVESNTSPLTATPLVTTEIPDGQDLLLVLVKSYVTPTLTLPAGVPVLTLQKRSGKHRVPVFRRWKCQYPRWRDPRSGHAQ
jgi:2-dehydropantoate 2-reductase